MRSRKVLAATLTFLAQRLTPEILEFPFSACLKQKVSKNPSGTLPELSGPRGIDTADFHIIHYLGSNYLKAGGLIAVHKIATQMIFGKVGQAQSYDLRMVTLGIDTKYDL